MENTKERAKEIEKRVYNIIIKHSINAYFKTYGNVRTNFND